MKTRMLLYQNLAFLLFVLHSVQAQGVVGGQSVDAEDAPWVAALIDRSVSTDGKCADSGGSDNFCQHHCGGVLIAPRWVLTAAHCLANRSPTRDFRVLLDTPDLTEKPTEEFGVSRAIRHPDASDTPTLIPNKDIALLRLDGASDTTPASLMRAEALESIEADPEAHRDQLHVFGWGRLYDDGPFPDLMQRVAVDPITDEVTDLPCGAAFDPDSMICATERSPEKPGPDDTGLPRPDGQDACEKDSGGPLVHYRNDRPLVAGLVSWGQDSDCGDPDSPTAYTRIPAFLEWVETATADEDDPLANPGVQIDTVRSREPGSMEEVHVALKNRGQENPVKDPGFRIEWNLFSDDSDDGSGGLVNPRNTALSCEEVQQENAYECTHDGTLEAGAKETVTFSAATFEDGNDFIDISAEGFHAPDQTDYEQAGNETFHRLAWSNKPNLKLHAHGLVPELSDDDSGTLWAFLRIENASSHEEATGVTLTVSPPSDHLLLDYTDCSATPEPVCNHEDLAPGEKRDIIVRMQSPTRRRGTLELELSSDQGNFPSITRKGDDDFRIKQEIRYPSPESESGNATTGSLNSSDGFGIGKGVLLAGSVLLWLRRKTA